MKTAEEKNQRCIRRLHKRLDNIVKLSAEGMIDSDRVLYVIGLDDIPLEKMSDNEKAFTKYTDMNYMRYCIIENNGKKFRKALKKLEDVLADQREETGYMDDSIKEIIILSEDGMANTLNETDRMRYRLIRKHAGRLQRSEFHYGSGSSNGNSQTIRQGW